MRINIRKTKVEMYVYSTKNELLDTGSGGSVFKMDVVKDIGITIEDDDVIESISGVGGTEFVYKKDIESISLGMLKLDNFKIEVGVMDYGFEINGILGMKSDGDCHHT